MKVTPNSIEKVELRDAGAFATYLLAHMAESGKNGAPVFAPGHRPSREELRDLAQVRWARNLSDPNWGRAWVYLSETGSIVGHLELRGGRIPSELHRTTLGMGLMQAYTRKGLGGQLVDTAIRWARNETRLVWMDLGVFANNAPALKLYERKGFVRQYLRQDAFRAEDGTSLDDICMSIRLK